MMRRILNVAGVAARTLAITAWSANAVLADCTVNSPKVVEQSPDWCLTGNDCQWDAKTSVCLSSAAAAKLPKDTILRRTGYDLVALTNGQTLSLASDVLRDTIGMRCPVEVIDYAQRYPLPPIIANGQVFGLLSPSDYLNWGDSIKPGPGILERKIRLRAAWLSLRNDGACRTWLKTHEPTDTLVMQLNNEAKANWALSKRGNAFIGVVDCRNWSVTLIPQNPRTNKATGKPFDQIPWTDSQLSKVKFTIGGPKPDTPPYKLDPNKGIDHGVTALMAEGKSLAPPPTFSGWCQQERDLKANYLGFNVWTDPNSGQMQISLTSRQLNGPNLDSNELRGGDSHENPDAKNPTIATVYDGRGISIFNPDGSFNSSGEDDMMLYRGIFKIELAVALKKALAPLPLPKD